MKRMILRMHRRHVVGIAAFLWFCTSGLPGPQAHAEPLSMQSAEPPLIQEIRMGLLAHDVDHLWSGSRAEEGVDLNAELIFSRPAWHLFKGTLQPNIGFSLNDSGGTSKVYGGVLWQVEGERWWFFSTGLGVALHNGELDTERSDKKSLGSQLLFRVPIEIGINVGTRHRIAIMFDHVSNAYLADPNEGMDTLGLRYGYRF